MASQIKALGSLTIHTAFASDINQLEWRQGAINGKADIEIKHMQCFICQKLSKVDRLLMTDPYTQGHNAAVSGDPQHANPYTKGTTPALWWLRGWQEAMMERAMETQAMAAHEELAHGA